MPFFVLVVMYGYVTGMSTVANKQGESTNVASVQNGEPFRARPPDDFFVVISSVLTNVGKAVEVFENLKGDEEKEKVHLPKTAKCAF